MQLNTINPAELSFTISNLRPYERISPYQVNDILSYVNENRHSLMQSAGNHEGVFRVKKKLSNLSHTLIVIKDKNFIGIKLTQAIQRTKNTVLKRVIDIQTLEIKALLIKTKLCTNEEDPSNCANFQRLLLSMEFEARVNDTEIYPIVYVRFNERKYKVAQLQTFFPAGDLKMQAHSLSQNTQLNLAIKICVLLRKLHNLKCVHADLKLENVLFNEEIDLIRLIDFDYFFHINDKMFRGGTYINLPPEMWQKQLGVKYEEYTYATDAWALGCLLCELFNKGHLTDWQKRLSTSYFSGSVKDDKEGILNDIANFRAHLTEELDPLIPVRDDVFEIPNPFKPIIAKLLQIDPTKRASVNEALEDLQRLKNPKRKQNFGFTSFKKRFIVVATSVVVGAIASFYMFK